MSEELQKWLDYIYKLDVASISMPIFESWNTFTEFSIIIGTKYYFILSNCNTLLLNVLIYRFEKNIIEKVRMPGTTLFEVRSITLLIDNEEFMHDILIVFPWNYESLWSFNWVKGSTVFTGNENYGPFKIARMVISWGF